MDHWIRFDEELPSQGQFIVAITQRDLDLPIELWELDLEKNAVGTWVDDIVWVGNRPQQGYTHWLELPNRPLPPASTDQLLLGRA